MSMWNELGIEPTRERRAIKLAYAARLKVNNPEDNPHGFQLLRQAYERALALADSNVAPLPAAAWSGDDGAAGPADAPAAGDGFPTLNLPERTARGAGAPPVQAQPRRSGRAPLPALALGQPLAQPLVLNLRLETDAEIAQQAGQPRAPGPRPVTQYFQRPAPAIDDAALAAAVRRLCAGLLVVEPAAREATFVEKLRERQWRAPAFTQRLVPFLVEVIDQAWETHWPLVAPIAAYYGWESSASARRDMNGVAVLVQRAQARAWSLPILSLAPGHPARTALAMLAGELDEAAAWNDVKNASRVGAVRALVDQLKGVPGEVLPHLVDPRTLGWWQRYLAQPAKSRGMQDRADQLIQRAAVEAQAERRPALLLRPVAGKRGGWKHIAMCALLVLIVVVGVKLYVG